VIEAFVKNRPELYRQYAQPDAQSYLECQIECENHFPFVEDGFLLDRAEKLTANTPYYMGDGMFGPSIRIEWLHEGEVWYLSFLQFRNGKVSRVNTIRAAVPLLLPAPAQPDEAPSTNATPGPK
jgi:hypothetical protein